MSKTVYNLEVCGLKRELPICKINDEISFAAFVMFGDVELTVAAAEALLWIAPGFDIILTAEAKGIPIAYEMSRQSGKKYVVARKMLKQYMRKPVAVPVKSISTAVRQELMLDKSDFELLRGKKVLVVDDVISLGESINALVRLVETAGGKVAKKMAVLAEGDASKRDDIVYLGTIPIITND